MADHRCITQIWIEMGSKKVRNQWKNYICFLKIDGLPRVSCGFNKHLEEKDHIVFP